MPRATFRRRHPLLPNPRQLKMDKKNEIESAGMWCYKQTQMDSRGSALKNCAVFAVNKACFVDMNVAR